MDFQEIKEFIEKEGGKVLIVENGKPALVVMSFSEYQNKSRGVAKDPEPMQEPQAPSLRAVPAEPVRPENRPAPEELTIEDLPL